MSLPDLFKSLVLDSWYKAFVYLGGTVLALSFFIETKGISNGELQLLAGGVFLVGCGEWKNRKKVSSIKPPNAYTGPAMLLTSTVRAPDAVGILLDISGACLIGQAIYSSLAP